MENEDNRPKCFVSYCHENIDRQMLDFFVNFLEQESKNKIEFLYDMKEIGPGKRFHDFMDLLRVVEVVIIVLTPEYKRRVINRQPGGVWTEFQLIYSRYEENKQRKKEAQDEFLKEYFFIIPVLLSGKDDDILLDEFKDHKYVDLRKTYLIEKTQRGVTELTLSDAQKKQFNKDARSIIETILALFTLKQPIYEKEVLKYYDNVLMNRLFFDTKADFDNPKFQFERYEKTLFVQNYAYQQVENQSAYFIIGRKGSGKSAITQVLPKRCQRRYFQTITVKADQIDLSLLYNVIPNNFRSDSTYLARKMQCLEFTWRLFIRLLIIAQIDEMLTRKQLNFFQESRAISLREFMAKLKGDGTIGLDTNANSFYFTYSFISAQRFLAACIKSARSDEEFFYSDIVGKFTLENFLRFVFGTTASKDFDEFITTIRTNILFSLDGFDAAFDRFRSTTGTYDYDSEVYRANFERDWLNTLLQLVIDLKQLNTGDRIFSDKLDFCITIPVDRFLEILEKDRDRYRFGDRYKVLIWTGPELVIFLRKRLEVSSGYRVQTDNVSPEKTLEEILTKAFDFIPQKLSFDFNAAHIEIPLFLYVLRHTFWRPRDILTYYAHIITMASEMYRNRHPVSIEAIRVCVANTTTEIIKSEFINEYQTTLKNIREIIESFSRCPQILSFDQLREKIDHVNFQFILNESNRALDPIYKIKFLYQIGFLGLYADNNMMDRFSLSTNHVFVFSEGSTPVNNLNMEAAKTIRFIIHPIFCEFLNLDTKKSEFISNYSWKYLTDMEGVMQASNNKFIVEY